MLHRLYITTLLLLLTFNLSATTLFDQVKPVTRDKENRNKKELPLYELGVASINSWTHDYPGASQGQFVPLVVPTIVYRGEIFRSDSEGSRARLLDKRNYEFSVSFGGNFPVNSRDNTARNGMTTLGQIIQAGPKLIYFLVRNKTTKLYFDIAARTGFAVGRSWGEWRGVGVTGDIGINYRQKISSFEVFMLLYTSAASYELHKYFYDVKPEFVTASREYYHSRSGYLGTNLLFALSKDFSKKFSVFVGGGASFLEGHVNSKSPVFKENINARGVIGLKYTLYYSDKKVIE